ncbi:unnamed protein product, partial [Gongylonema pulchrum]|uniref:HTH OST-type domain-containing protein n=1 Tax=Gongylonema pulchrum TaxID=637853 RepID=A0A183DG89_9BILA
MYLLLNKIENLSTVAQRTGSLSSFYKFLGFSTDKLIALFQDVNSVNMFDRNLVKIKLEGNADVSTATGLKNQEHSEMAVISEKILDIKKESEEHCELEVKTEASSDIEEENPEHLEMKFEIDQEYTEMLN